MRLPLGHLALFFIFSSIKPLGGEEQCDALDGKCNSTQYNAEFWRYLSLIGRAVDGHVDCPLGECHCFDESIEKSLGRFAVHGITRSMLEPVHKTVLYQIIDHKLYRLGTCAFPSRCSGVEHFLLNVVNELPNTEFRLNDFDYPLVDEFRNSQAAVFSFSTTENEWDIMYPAWSFWEGGPSIEPYPAGIGRWDLIRETLYNASLAWPWQLKKSKGFFRGSRTNAKRDALILLSRREPGLIVAEYTKNQAWKSEKDTLGLKAVKELPFEYNCRYKYLFNFVGVAASFRLRHLFLCRSVVLNVASDWQEFFYVGLKPWVHYVPVKEDSSDVEELLQFLRQNDRVAQDIAERGFKFIWNHLKMEDVQCYWKTLLRRYSQLLRYDVTLRDGVEPVVG